MPKTEQLFFHYDPIILTRRLLELFAGRADHMVHIPGEDPKSESLLRTVSRALHEMTDDDITQAVDAYAVRYGLTTISFENGLTDIGKVIAELIRPQKWQDYRRDLRRDGADGYAVYDKKTDVLILTEFGLHWATMNELLREHDPAFYAEMKRVRKGKAPIYTTQAVLDAELLARMELIGSEYKPTITRRGVLGLDAMELRWQDRLDAKYDAAQQTKSDTK